MQLAEDRIVMVPMEFGFGRTSVDSHGLSPLARAVAACPDENAFLRFVEGSFAASELAEFERHIDTCAACAELLFGTASARCDDAEIDAEVASNEHDPAHASIAGRYVVGERLGAGGMGVVHWGYDPRLDRRVAIKVIRRALPDDADSSAGEAERGGEVLRREAQVLAQLAHPNIVEVYDVGVGAAGLYVAMELVEGRSLRAWQDKEAPRWRDVVAVYLGVGDALAAAHEREILHGDFKPDNAMIMRDGHVKVLDFGLARSFTCATATTFASLGARQPATASEPLGRIAGTPAYLAPECWIDGVYDPGTDQFAFFVALYEALAGRRPFRGDDRRALLASMLRGASERPLVDAGVPRRLRGIVMRGLAAAPAARFPSLREALAELRGTLHGPRGWIAVVSATVVAGLVLAWPIGDDARCEDPRARVEAVWSRADRVAIASAFEPLGPALSAEPVIAGIDADAADWAAAYAELCADGGAAIDARAYDLKMSCLQSRSVELETLVDLFVAGDPAVLARARVAVTEMPPASACVDDDAPTRDAIGPSESSRRRAWQELSDQLARAEAHERTGMSSVAARMELAAAAAARDEGWTELEARALLKAGINAAGLGDTDSGVELLQTAFFRADAVALDDVAGRAATELAGTLGYSESRTTEGEAWLRRARIHLARSGVDAADDYDYQLNAGLLYERAAEPEAAIGHYTRALELVQHGMLAAASHANLANAYELAGRTEDALAHHRSAVEAFASELGPSHPGTVTAQANLAGCLAAHGHADEAEPLFLDLLAHFDDPLAAAVPIQAMALSNYGSLLTAAGRLDEALSRYREALARLEARFGPDHPGTVNLYLNIGVALANAGRIDDGLAELQRARAVLGRAEASPADLADLDHIEAAMQREAGRPAQALARELQAVRTWSRWIGPDDPRLREALASVDEDLAALSRASAP